MPSSAWRKLSTTLVVASPDIPAQVLYLKSGFYLRFPAYYFTRSPERVPFNSDLVIKSVRPSSKVLAVLGEIDQTILGFTRPVDHKWFASDRQGYLYFRGDQLVGYGYLGDRNGPFALLHESDLPTVLAHAESQALDNGRKEFSLEIPNANQVAVDYLLGRGFRMDSFVSCLMNDEHFASFEKYILTSPPFFL